MIRTATANDEARVLALVEAWPTHFVDAARPLVLKDFREGRTLIYEESGMTVGFVTWKEVPNAIEILWIAVEPKALRKGIGRSLIMEVESTATSAERVFLKTATTDSVIPGTGFSGPAYQGTHEFFQRMGYEPRERIADAWGRGNHCLIMEKRISD